MSGADEDDDWDTYLDQPEALPATAPPAGDASPAVEPAPAQRRPSVWRRVLGRLGRRGAA